MCADRLHGPGSPSGTRRSRPTGPRAPRCPRDPRPTSPSWARATPGCGPPTTSPRPTRPADRGAGGGGRGLRRVRAQRRLVLGALPLARSTAAQHGAMRETVDEVARAAAAEGIDAHLAKGGTISLARTPAQLARARAEVAEARSHGPRRGRPRAARQGRGGRRAPRQRHARGDLHAGLRRHPSRPPGARARRRGRAARCRGSTSAPGSPRSRPTGSMTAHGIVTRRRGRAGHRGLHRPAGRAASAPSRRSTR